MSASTLDLSSSQVKKAGQILRRSLRGEGGYTVSDIQAAAEVVDAWRAAHQQPLVKANNGLRSMVKTCGYEPKVTQRLKRLPTILDKLHREPTLALPRMQDIGGCRAVLPSIGAVRAVEARVKKQRSPISVSDYITNPKRSGYRSLHLVVTYDERAIEIQLRTEVMHEWAVTVERLSSRVGQNLKGEGSHVVQDLMAAISEAMRIEELGQIVPADLQCRIQELREQAQPYLAGRR